MPRRRIGQEALGFTAVERGRNAGLDELAATVDWTAVERQLGGIYTARRGEAAWPPLAMFKALLLAIWHDLSDVQLAAALDDRASFRRFCGFALHEPVPERTAFVRFRRELVRFQLDRVLFREVVRQLEAKGLMVKTGTLVDATIIRSARKDDDNAGWSHYPKRGAPVHGYKAHVATDGAGNFVRKLVVTPANFHDSYGLDLVLPRHPGRVYADAAYDSGKVRERIRARRGEPVLVRRIDPRSPAARNDAKRVWNRSVAQVRCRIERVFGTCKRSYGLARARWKGLSRMAMQVHLTAIAFNLKRAAALLRPDSARIA